MDTGALGIVRLFSVCALVLSLSACGDSGGDGGLAEELENVQNAALAASRPEADLASSQNPGDDSSAPQAGNDSPGSAADDPNAGSSENSSIGTVTLPLDDGAIPVTIAPIFQPNEYDIYEPQAPYIEDGYANPDVMRMQVRTLTTAGVCTSANTSGCTLADVIADTDKHDDLKVSIPVHMSADDFIDGGALANAQLQQRGDNVRLGEQKSFKVQLNPGGLWRNERSVLLNKHPFDENRVRNKLAFDLLRNVPHLPGFRTQFVNLWLDNGQGAKDYGLFTHVESPSAEYLRRRGLNGNGRLYRVNNFSFSKHDLENVLVNADGQPLDRERFEQSLSIESGVDHRPLMQMLTDLHDPSQSFEALLSRYFNDNNILTWLTVNLLFNHSDTTTRNYVLFNPFGTERFYFLPWNFDSAFTTQSEPVNDTTNEALKRRLEYGYAGVNDNYFITRYYQRSGAHQRFLEAAAHMRQNWLTDERVNELAAGYGAITKPWVSRPPDSLHNTDVDDQAVAQYAAIVSQNENALSTSYHLPIPPMIKQDPKLFDGQWVFHWTPAYDLTGRALSYELLISSSVQFNASDISVHVSGISFGDQTLGTSLMSIGVDASLIGSGTNYARIIARPDQEPERFWQTCANTYTQAGVTWYGVMAFQAP